MCVWLLWATVDVLLRRNKLVFCKLFRPKALDLTAWFSLYVLYTPLPPPPLSLPIYLIYSVCVCARVIQNTTKIKLQSMAKAKKMSKNTFKCSKFSFILQHKKQFLTQKTLITVNFGIIKKFCYFL